MTGITHAGGSCTRLYPLTLVISTLGGYRTLFLRQQRARHRRLLEAFGAR